VPRNLEEPPPSRPAYFWWLLANALALCFAIISWVVCLDVFGNPENPRNYQILGKIGRLPQMKRYSVVDVPSGNALAPEELYRKYFSSTKKQQAQLNSLLLRNYLTNFDRPLSITYVEGDFQIKEARQMDEKDFFQQGIAVRAQAMVSPDDFTKPMPYPVWVEYLFPTTQVDKAAAFKPGDTLSIKKSPNCAVVIHSSTIVDDGETALILTVVPIAYGLYPLANSGSFGIEPPLRVNPGAVLPMLMH
jgi:hypothetical protein